MRASNRSLGALGRKSVRIFRRWPGFAPGVAVLALAAAAGVGVAPPTAHAGSAAPGQAPGERDENADGWRIHNYDLANTRATSQAEIDSGNVSRLAVKWRFPVEGPGVFGVSSTPIVVGRTVYVIDTRSAVYALDRDSGRLRWRRDFDSLSIGPNGVAYHSGLLYGVTSTGVFALDPQTGATRWSRELFTGSGGIDIAPQPYADTVLVSTVPATFTGYPAGGMGIVWALDARTGVPKWQFNTVKDGDLWGHPEINSGGGLWYPPAVDEEGRLFLAVANPAPFPGTAEFPNGSSRPGPNLYTNSLVALDSRTGRLLWYQQALPHDLRDYDLEASPIVTKVPIAGVSTEVVLVAGKMGVVYAYRAADGHPLWTLPVGTHQNDVGPLPDEPVAVLPGVLGGVETPMALANGRLFVPWLDLVTMMSSTEFLNFFPALPTATGGLTAVDAATGRVDWERSLPQMVFGAATVSNDVVFTSTYDGTIYAFDTRDGSTLWTATARAGINSFPAVVGDTLLVAAAAPGFFQHPVSELIAYAL